MEGQIRLFSQRAIAISTFIGGPIAAGILIRRNSITLGRVREGKLALAIGIIFTFLLSLAIFSTPEEILDRIPSALIPSLYMGLTYLIVNKIHGSMLDLHKKNEGIFHSNWKAAGIGAYSLIITAVIFVLSYLLLF